MAERAYDVPKGVEAAHLTHSFSLALTQSDSLSLSPSSSFSELSEKRSNVLHYMALELFRN